tara:strand:+ start:613 stop:831 length:219 start_codon:yes stop_codon:yes gene_type:complete
MKNKPSILTSYKKGLKIINSCKDFRHLKVAKNYINQFLNVYKEMYYPGYQPAYSLYGELYIAYENKYDSLYK